MEKIFPTRQVDIKGIELKHHMRLILRSYFFPLASLFFVR